MKFKALVAAATTYVRETQRCRRPDLTSEFGLDDRKMDALLEALGKKNVVFKEPGTDRYIVRSREPSTATPDDRSPASDEADAAKRGASPAMPSLLTDSASATEPSPSAVDGKDKAEPAHTLTLTAIPSPPQKTREDEPPGDVADKGLTKHLRIQPSPVPDVAAPSPEIHELRLAEVEPDMALQARAEMDPKTIEEYARSMADGAKFPPPVLYFDGAKLWLADGFSSVGRGRKGRARQPAVRDSPGVAARCPALLHRREPGAWAAADERGQASRCPVASG